MIRFLLLLSLWCAFPLAAQTRDEALAHARAFLTLKPEEARAVAQKLSAAEARALSSQILQLSRGKNPDMEKLSPILEQLANIAAAETGQRRLNNLLLVILLTLGLFSAFLAFTLYDQRRILRTLTERAQLPGQPQPTVTVAAAKKSGATKRRR